MRLDTRAAPRPAAAFTDQAAGLRRMFAHRGVRLLPVLVPASRCEVRSAWLAALARGFAREGSRTMVVDGARLQVAAALGLRARYDLLHALRGECRDDAVLLDAAPGLAVMPAARALDEATGSGASLAQLLGPRFLSARRWDLAMLLLPAAASRLLPDGPVLVPAQPTREDVAAVLAEMRRASEGGNSRDFRLLLLGIAAGAGTTLTERIAAWMAMGSTARISHAGAALTAADLARVVRLVETWELPRLPRDTERCS